MEKNIKLNPLTVETIEKTTEASRKALESLKGAEISTLNDKTLLEKMTKFYQEESY